MEKKEILYELEKAELNLLSNDPDDWTIAQAILRKVIKNLQEETE